MTDTSDVQHESDLVLHQRKIEQVIDNRVSSAKVELFHLEDILAVDENWTANNEEFWGPLVASCWKDGRMGHLNGYIINNEELVAPQSSVLIGTLDDEWEAASLDMPNIAYMCRGTTLVQMYIGGSIDGSGTALQLSLLEGTIPEGSGYHVQLSYLLASAIAEA